MNCKFLNKQPGKSPNVSLCDTEISPPVLRAVGSNACWVSVSRDLKRLEGETTHAKVANVAFLGG